MAFKVILLSAILLAANFHLSNAFPARRSSPESKHTCTVDKTFFNDLKKAITDVIKSREEISLKTSENQGDCSEDLNEIVHTLKQIHNETTLVRKDEGDSIEDLEKLKEAFQDKMADFIREQDIFQKDFDLKQLRTKGELYDKVHKLRVEIRDLEGEIRETEEEYLQTAFELIKTSLESGLEKEKAENYAKTIPDDRLIDLVIYVQDNQKTVKEALNLLAKANTGKYIMEAISESIKLKFEKMTKVTEETLFQWASNRSQIRQ